MTNIICYLAEFIYHIVKSGGIYVNLSAKSNSSFGGECPQRAAAFCSGVDTRQRARLSYGKRNNSYSLLASPLESITAHKSGCAPFET
jgi:hypothetical protein